MERLELEYSRKHDAVYCVAQLLHVCFGALPPVRTHSRKLGFDPCRHLPDGAGWHALIEALLRVRHGIVNGTELSMTWRGACLEVRPHPVR